MESLESGTQQSSQPQEVAPKKPKRFQCHRCQRMFARLEHLQRHERTHTQEKPFPCQQCEQRFSRSDLLVRHERLNHEIEKNLESGRDEPPTKRRRSSLANNTQHSLMSPGLTGYASAPHGSEMPFATLLMAAEQAHPVTTGLSHQSGMHHDMYQQTHALMPPPMQQQQEHQVQQQAMNIPTDSILPASFSGVYDFEDSLNDLANFMENPTLSTFHFQSYINSEQPMPFFSPESYTHNHDLMQSTELQPQQTNNRVEYTDDNGSFSRYGSRLPSLQPEEGLANEKHLRDDLAVSNRSIADVTQEDRQKWLTKLNDFSPVLPTGFQLPTRLALSRYVAGYINGFHEHLPFLHIPTMNADTCCIELFLAMAAVGAQYCFEGEKGVELFTVSQAIAQQRIRQRDSRLAAFHKHVESQGASSVNGFDYSAETPRSASVSGPLGLPSQFDEAGPLLQREDLMQTAQALLVLMAMATWAKHREILREALAIQSILATLVRDDGLKGDDPPTDVDWRSWARHESCKRTKFIVYAFFNLHCIVYNIPALIMSSEINMTLPCNAAEFKATSEVKWRDARTKSTTVSIPFQDALARLFSKGGNGHNASGYNSSLGNYILVHALLQHIFFVRQVSRQRPLSSGEIPAEDISLIELSLRNWQATWKSNPESSLDPLSPAGPVPFNSTALLRLAYIRLNVDIGPGRALDTRDPVQIARAFRDSPALKRGPKLLRAVLHSAHALSIPIKIGIRLVAQTQTFNWSIQHSLCTLECAFLLSKWLEALSLIEYASGSGTNGAGSGGAGTKNEITADERKIASLVKTMLEETEFAVPDHVVTGETRSSSETSPPSGGGAMVSTAAANGNGSMTAASVVDSPATMKYLSASVLRVWAKVFRGAQTWAIVDIIGNALNLYADMLEAG